MPTLKELITDLKIHIDEYDLAPYLKGVLTRLEQELERLEQLEKENIEVITILTFLNAIKPLEVIKYQDGTTLYRLNGNYICKEQAELLKKHLKIRENVINT